MNLHGISTGNAWKHSNVECMTIWCSRVLYTPIMKNAINGTVRQNYVKRIPCCCHDFSRPAGVLQPAQAVNIHVFTSLNIETFFCSPPRVSSPSKPAGCRDNAKHSPAQQQQHSTGKDLELCKYWMHLLLRARTGRNRSLGGGWFGRDSHLYLFLTYWKYISHSR